MRETFTTLQTQAHNYTQTASTDTGVNTFLKSELNRAQRFVFAELEEYIGQKNAQTTTADGQQYYDYPRDLSKLETVKITIGSVDYDLDVVNSADYWNEINAVTFSGSAIPKFFFPRKDDFGIWPEPQDDYTMLITYSYQPKDMSASDYTTGTIALTNGDATVTGSGTTFTSAMVGRWINGDGHWYKIGSFTSTTSLELAQEFDGTTASGLSYTIGESPDIPAEAHELLSFRAAARYFMGLKNNQAVGQFWENMFFTGDGVNRSRDPADAAGGLLGLKKRYSRRSNSRVVRMRRRGDRDILVDKHWATVIS